MKGPGKARIQGARSGIDRSKGWVFFFCLVRTCTENVPMAREGATSESHPVYISLSREAKDFTRAFVSFAKPVLNKLLPLLVESPFPHQAQLALGSYFSCCPTQAYLDFPVLLISHSSSCLSHLSQICPSHSPFPTTHPSSSPEELHPLGKVFLCDVCTSQ